MTTIEFKFALRQRVLILEIQRIGTIDMIQIDNLGVSYRVAYWDNSERKIVWLYDHEIEVKI